MKSNVVVLILSLFLVSTVSAREPVNAQPVEKRGGIVQLGLGWGFMSHGASLDSALAQAQASGSRFTIYSEAIFGWAIHSQVYLVGGLSGFTDRVTVKSRYMQLNTLLISGGFRYYPLTTGFLLGADFGMAAMALNSDMLSFSVTGKPGFGFKGTFAYDFAPAPAASGIIVGGSITMSQIEGRWTQGVGLFAGWAWK